MFVPVCPPGAACISKTTYRDSARHQTYVQTVDMCSEHPKSPLVNARA